MKVWELIDKLRTCGRDNTVFYLDDNDGDLWNLKDCVEEDGEVIINILNLVKNRDHG